MSGKYVILLTACVNPQGMVNTLHADCQQRKKEYQEAISFYLQQTRLPIIFCENTLCDMRQDFSSYIESGRFEYFTFNGNHYDKQRGKGVGEVEIMKYAYSRSKLLHAGDNVIKITGRLKVLNIRKFIVVRQLFGDNYIQVRIGEDGVFTQSQFFIAPMSFLKEHFFPLEKDIDDSKCNYFEHVLGCSIREQKKYRVIPFFNFPLIEGVSGTFGIPYETQYSLLDRLYYIKYSIYKNILFNKKHVWKKQCIVDKLLIKCYYGVLAVFVFILDKINEK